jgi:hypothetical protein
MKKIAILMVGLALSATALAGDFEKNKDKDDRDNVTCSLETLHGTYAWGYSAIDSTGPYSTSGRESYDGKGHMKWYQLYNDGGTFPQTYSGTGIYTVSADCVAQVAYDGFHRDVSYTYFLIPDGDGYFWNNNFTEGTVSGGRVSRISKALLVH